MEICHLAPGSDSNAVPIMILKFNRFFTNVKWIPKEKLNISTG